MTDLIWLIYIKTFGLNGDIFMSNEVTMATTKDRENTVEPA